jgi:hypothetical protein
MATPPMLAGMPPSGSQVRVSAPPDVHPTMEELDRFMHCALPMDEFSAVVRHLLTGCRQCKRVTGALWKTLKGPPDLEDLPEALDASPRAYRRRWPRAGARRRLPRRPSPEAYAAMASAGRELVRELTGELEALRDRFQTLIANLPDDSEVGGENEELQAVLGCVLHDSMQPMIETLRAVAAHEDEPDEEEPEIGRNERKQSEGA